MCCRADANKGHAFGILMAFVGALRTFGAPALLTFGIRHSLFTNRRLESFHEH